MANFSVVDKKEEDSPAPFEPFTLQITCNSIEELQSLFHRMNAGSNFGQHDTEGNPYHSTSYQKAHMDTWASWVLVNDELQRQMTNMKLS